MATKLTIHQNRNTPATDWHQCGKYNQSVNDLIADNTGAQSTKTLSAIPSPFARMHLFETAFEMINVNRDHDGSSIYHKMISDCFDVLEILFNWDQLISAGNRLEIRVLDRTNALHNLVNSNDRGHRNLGEVLDLFLRQDAQSARFQYSTNFYLLVYNSEVFAGSSPMTLFFVRADLNNIKIRKNASGFYFEAITPFYKRSEEFQQYVHLLFHSSPEYKEKLAKMFIYLTDSINKIQTHKQEFRVTINQIYATQFNNIAFEQKYKPVYDSNNNPLTIYHTNICRHMGVKSPGTTLMIKPSKALPQLLGGKSPIVPKQYHDSEGRHNTNIIWPEKTNVGINNRVLVDRGLLYPYLTNDDFLEDTLVQVNYPINEDYFVTGKYQGFNRVTDNGFLLPIKTFYLEFFNLNEVSQHLTFIKINQGIKVELEIPVQGGFNVKFEKSYYPTATKGNEGRLITAKFNFAIFPFYRVNVPQFNDYYKILVVNDDTLSTTIQRDYIFEFYKDDRRITEEPDQPYFVKKTSRVERHGIESSSTYYEIKNTFFNIIVVNCSQLGLRAMIIPMMKEVPLGEKKFTVAVDFGTTNTFVALTDDQHYNTFPEPLKIGEGDIQVVAFNRPNNDLNQKNIINKYEKISSEVFPLVIRQTHEFIPSIIGVDAENVVPKYSFPIRTVISEKKNLNLSVRTNADFLGNMNISFVYEKEPVRQEEEQITSDLKWTTKNNLSNELRIECYITELLLLIKNKIILNGGNPSHSKLIWFRPLSMGQYSRNLFAETWTNSFHRIFRNEEDPECITESQAPYYYILHDDQAYSSQPILCIDIGGGSTDIVFFNNRVPQIGTSFNFAGNAIWGSGLGHIARNYNVIILKYSQRISGMLQSAEFSDEEKGRLENIIKGFNPQNTRSEDLMNLYFTLDNYFGLVGEMKRDSSVKFLILLHLSAIIYHSAQIMKYSKMSPPRFISLTGRGSRYIHIIEPNFQKNGVTSRLVNSIISEIYQSPCNVEIITHAGNEKEATCYGGIFYKTTTDPEPKPKVYLGEYPFNNFNDIIKLKYSEIDKIKVSVINNITNFYNVFFDLNKNCSFKDNYDIELNLDDIKKYLIDNTPDYLEHGIDYRLQISNENEEIGETLFFYPLIKAIFELTKIL